MKFTERENSYGVWVEREYDENYILQSVSFPTAICQVCGCKGTHHHVLELCVKYLAQELKDLQKAVKVTQRIFMLCSTGKKEKCSVRI